MNPIFDPVRENLTREEWDKVTLGLSDDLFRYLLDRGDQPLCWDGETWDWESVGTIHSFIDIGHLDREGNENWIALVDYTCSDGRKLVAELDINRTTLNGGRAWGWGTFGTTFEPDAYDYRTCAHVTTPEAIQAVMDTDGRHRWQLVRYGNLTPRQRTLATVMGLDPLPEDRWKYADEGHTCCIMSRASGTGCT